MLASTFHNQKTLLYEVTVLHINWIFNPGTSYYTRGINFQIPSLYQGERNGNKSESTAIGLRLRLAGICTSGNCVTLHRSISRPGTQQMGYPMGNDCVCGNPTARLHLRTNKADSVLLATNRLLLWCLRNHSSASVHEIYQGSRERNLELRFL